MASDQTQHQSPEDIRKSRDLSLEPQRPPSEIPGYEILDFLGSGAYGEVWSAMNQKTGRKVAVKFYTRRSSADVQLLAREVEKLVVLAADRYVVQLHDVGWDAQPPYYVMDYIEHGSLDERLSQTEPLPTAVAVDLFQEVATGMMHLHGKGILHCDLKPGNILLDQDGKPRVADFGQSRLSTEQSSALGTLFFMAPEQADMNAAPDARWDVYGLGALLFCMLTGKPPYYTPEISRQIESTQDINERLKKYREGLQRADKPTAHRQVPGVDRMLADIIDNCIAANPKNRFSSIQSVLFALRQREVTRARRPLMVLGLLGPLLLMAVMALFGWWAYNRAVGDTEAEITNKAKESNSFAAQFAARSAGYQIDEYFRVVGQLARDPEFLKAFGEFDRNPELAEIRKVLANTNNSPSSDTPEFSALRKKFTTNPLQNKLIPFLEKRMYDSTGDYPLAASWFISDRWGNQVASVFPLGQKNKTIGMNWAYRTYFTGLPLDLKTKIDGREVVVNVPDEEEKRTIIQRPHLCAIFRSKQSDTWKIAFSAPIRIDDSVRGIVAVTAEVGHFVKFIEDSEKKQYAMLVDDRPCKIEGENTTGVVLEHPLFDKLPVVDEQTSEQHLFVIDKKVIDAGKTFFDPVGIEQNVEDYAQESIAAYAPVERKPFFVDLESGENDLEKPVDTNLYVIVVEDYQSIIRPALVLGKRLGLLALTAALFFVLVTLGMWILVARMLRDSRKQLDRSFSPTSDSSLLEKVKTADGPQVTGA